LLRRGGDTGDGFQGFDRLGVHFAVDGFPVDQVELRASAVSLVEGKGAVGGGAALEVDVNDEELICGDAGEEDAVVLGLGGAGALGGDQGGVELLASLAGDGEDVEAQVAGLGCG
jgi:hypothetical protein